MDTVWLQSREIAAGNSLIIITAAIIPMVAHALKKMATIKTAIITKLRITTETIMIMMMSPPVRLLRANRLNPKIQIRTITAMETICGEEQLATVEAIPKFKSSGSASN